MLEPITAAIALGTTAYNLYAGHQNAMYQENALNKKRSLDNRLKQFKTQQVDNNFSKGLTDIAKQSGNALANMAQSGNVGAGAQAITSAQSTEATTSLEEWKTNAMQEIAFSSEASDMNYQSALDNINAGFQQKMTNSAFDMLGGAMSLGGMAVNAGAFDFLMKQPTPDPTWKDYGGRINYGSSASAIAGSKKTNQYRREL